MKKVLFSMAFLALLFPSLLSALKEKQAVTPQKAEVIAERADIFLEASQHSIVIDTIPRGATVTLFASGNKNKKWLYISYLSKRRNSQVTGFIDRKRVKILKASPDKIVTQENTEERTKEKVEQQEQEELRDLLLEMEKENKEKRIQEDEKKHPEDQEKTLPTQEELQQGEELQELQESNQSREQVNKPEKEDAGENTGSVQEHEEKSRREVNEDEMPGEEVNGKEEEGLPKVLTKLAVKVPRANIRLMPTTKSPVIHQVTSGVELEHIAKTANWHRVNLAPNKEGIVLSGYIHNNIVDEIFETVTDPEPELEEIPEKEPGIPEEEPETEPEPEPVQGVPNIQRSPFGKYYWVGGGAGYTMLSPDYFGNGLNIGVTFGFGLSKYLALEFRAPYFQSDVSGIQGGLSSGRLSSLSLMLSVQGRYPIKGMFVPYVVAGGDFNLNKFRLNEDIIDTWKDYGFSIQENVDHTFGFHFGAGLDVFLLQNIALNLDVRYYTANLSGSRTFIYQASQETQSIAIDGIKLNSFHAGISVKLFLDSKGKK